MRLLRAAAGLTAIAGAIVLLAGCDKLGEGTKPVGLRITDGVTATGPAQVTECGVLPLYALGEWDGDDHYESNVSDRATWTSDDPGVADVGDGVTRSAGEVFARGPGTTIVRAEYVGFTAVMPVTVLPIIAARIRPDIANLAPGSRQTFTFETRVDDDEGWVAQAPQWGILQTAAAATLEDGGVVQALGGPLDVPFVLEASLSNCAVAVQRELRVSPVSHLALEYEQPATQVLPLGLTAMLHVFAHFSDSAIEPQDLSGQVEVELQDTESGAATFTHYTESITLTGLEEGQHAQLEFRYEPLDLSVLSDVYVFADLDQETLRVDPPQLTVQYPDEVQLEAWARFSDGIERIVTRHVTWTVSDEAVATVTSETSGAGKLTVAQDVDQSIQVEVFGTIDDEVVTAESEIRIERTAD